MSKLETRVAKLESRGVAASTIWHRLIWGCGQSFDEMLAENNADSIPDTDNITVWMVVDPKGDPIRERDMPLYHAWCERRDLAVSIAKPG